MKDVRREWMERSEDDAASHREQPGRRTVEQVQIEYAHREIAFRRNKPGAGRRGRAVLAAGILYPKIQDAAHALNVSDPIIYRRIEKGLPGYAWIGEGRRRRAA